ncbi:MAG: polysaccharide biosynthesis C-terminal domain-containing protein, partial [Acidimicrobiales bacterium]
PGFSAFLFLMKAFQAMQDTRSVFYLYLVENGLNAVLAVALYPSLGVQGLALAYALAYTGGTAAALIVLQRRSGSVDIASVVQIWVRVGVASAIMAAAVVAVSVVVEPALFRATAGVIAGVSVYVLVARRLGVQELSTLLPMRRRLP